MNNKYPFSIIDVFTNTATKSKGNSSAVILLDKAASIKQMQEIAKYLRQPATTFLWAGTKENEFEVRWFAPDAEIELCGHGAMAASIFLCDVFKDANAKGHMILIRDKTKIKIGIKKAGLYSIELGPINHHQKSDPPIGLEAALGREIVAYHRTDNKQIVELRSEEDLKTMTPDFEALRKIDIFGYSVTAASDQNNDFVCRTIIPHVQELEDQATGSTQAILVPYWSKRLDKTHLISEQLSENGGYFEAFFTNNKLTLLSKSHYAVNGTFSL